MKGGRKSNVYGVRQYMVMIIKLRGEKGVIYERQVILLMAQKATGYYSRG